MVIPAAGYGTRLMPATKETPKEMLPVFTRDTDNRLLVKPLLQSIYEQLYDVGIREYCFIVGKGKGSITDHFTKDGIFLKNLNDNGKHELVEVLTEFYTKLDESSLVFVSQPDPRGFGDAVLKARPYINEPFLVQAGDTLILSYDNNHLKRLIDVHEKYQSKATILVKKIEDPRAFGVVMGKEIEPGVLEVTKVEEKPEHPQSTLAITAVYLFSPSLFLALQASSEGIDGEIQLTDGIQHMINSGQKVMAVELNDNEMWLDIGNPEAYWYALNRSYKYLLNQSDKE